MRTAAATGDLDITDTDGNLQITGAGSSQTIIDAKLLDRVFHIHPNASLSLTGLTITGGYTTSAGGGIL